MIRKMITIGATSGTILALSVSSVFAHVTVKPVEVGVGQRLNFVVSVPTEEADPTVQVRLVIPEGLQSVRPNVKPGWTIKLTKTGEGDAARTTEITWTGGRIPADQRDEFVFSAQAPSQATNLVWKAYQTYGDGDIVAWEVDPKVVAEYTKNNPPKAGEDDHSAPRPYSETKVVDDLSGSQKPAVTANTEIDGDGVVESEGTDATMWVAYVALVVAVLSLAFSAKGMMKPKAQPVDQMKQ